MILEEVSLAWLLFKDLLVCYNMVASIAQCEQLQEQLGAKGGGYKIRVGTRKNMDPSLW